MNSTIFEAIKAFINTLPQEDRDKIKAQYFTDINTGEVDCIIIKLCGVN